MDKGAINEHPASVTYKVDIKAFRDQLLDVSGGAILFPIVLKGKEGKIITR